MAAVKRRLFTMLSAVSLVASIGFLTSTVRGVFARDEVFWRHLSATEYTERALASDGGSIVVAVHWWRHLSPDEVGRVSFQLGPEADGWSGDSGLLTAPWRPLHFAWHYEADPPGFLSGRHWSLSVPAWLPAALFAILPAIWLWRWRRHRRATDDGMPHCAKCDYNLTGNVSGICPECGTPIPADLVRKPMT